VPETRTPSRQGRAYGRAEIEELFHDALVALMADGTPFRDLSVSRIVSTSGVARSTFYATFADKADLLNALSARCLGTLYVGARAWIRRGSAATRDDIAAGLRDVLAAYRENETVMRAVAEATSYEPTVRDAYVRGVEDYAAAIGRMLRKGAGDGVVRDVDVDHTASVVAWATESTVRRAALYADPAASDAAVVALADMVHRTLFRDPA
jgi:AcrR family transcriptional regulator